MIDLFAFKGWELRLLVETLDLAIDHGCHAPDKEDELQDLLDRLSKAANRSSDQNIFLDMAFTGGILNILTN